MRFRAVLETHEHRDLGAERAAVKRGRFLAAAVEEQVGLDVNGVSSSGFGVMGAGLDRLNPGSTCMSNEGSEIDTPQPILLATAAKYRKSCDARPRRRDVAG
jgi:hypothetical protein